MQIPFFFLVKSNSFSDVCTYQVDDPEITFCNQAW